MRAWELDPQKITVKRWSFCKSCKGRGCPQCNYTCKEVETILLSEVPKLLRQDYVDAQEDLIGKQLKEVSPIV